ncbi:MAG TPA: filamentous hemagglutinin N-terminal domain-containing protein [Paraburkholderia sp.]
MSARKRTSIQSINPSAQLAPRLSLALSPICRTIALMLAAGAAANAHAAGLVNLSQIGQTMRTGALAQELATGQALPAGSLPFAGSSAAGATAAQQHALQSVQNLANAAQVIAAQEAAQASAATQAAAAPSSVPNGLAVGGLQVLAGGTWMNASQPTQTTSNGQTTVTIQQVASDGTAQGAANTGKAILDWKTFNVGKNTTVYFNQSGGTQSDGTNNWTLLNVVSDPSAVPSQILGAIKAEGQVLLIDHNGIMFGGTSQINVHSLVASALDVTNAQFLQGIVNQQAYNTATFSINPPQFTDAEVTPAGNITVAPGAQIQTAPPPSVTAGGGSVYLTQSADPDVTGVTANVNNGGSVTNSAQGMLFAPTGNVSMVGLNVNQSGVALASTSVDQAGEVTLFARSGVTTVAGDVGGVSVYAVGPAQLGQVTLAAGSLTAVLPDETGETALAGQPQGQSVIKAEGETVDVLGGATVLAPAGKVKLQATDSASTVVSLDQPSLGIDLFGPTDAGRVYVAPGATIDVSGLQDVAEEAIDSEVLVDVQSNELRDSPVQHGGILTNQEIWVDIDPSELDDVSSS